MRLVPNLGCFTGNHASLVLDRYFQQLLLMQGSATSAKTPFVPVTSTDFMRHLALRKKHQIIGPVGQEGGLTPLQIETCLTEQGILHGTLAISKPGDLPLDQNQYPDMVGMHKCVHATEGLIAEMKHGKYSSMYAAAFTQRD